MNLDRTRPFAEVYGLPGALYSQDGRFFRGDDSLATDLSPPVEEEPPYSGPEINPPSVPCIEQASMPREKDGSTIEEMSWQQLKVLVEVGGGTWTNRKDAIAYLRGK